MPSGMIYAVMKHDTAEVVVLRCQAYLALHALSPSEPGRQLLLVSLEHTSGFWPEKAAHIAFSTGS